MSEAVIEKKAVRKEVEGTSTEFPTNFRDERGRDWTVRLSVPLIHAFCRSHKLSLSDIFQLGTMSADILLDLAYEGTRYQSRAVKEKQSKEEFLCDLDGPSFLGATGAAANAVLNFTLRLTPETERAAEKARIQALMEKTQERILGDGEKSLS